MGRTSYLGGSKQRLERCAGVTHTSLRRKGTVKAKLEAAALWCFYSISKKNSYLPGASLTKERLVGGEACKVFRSQGPGLLKFMSIESVMPSNHFILCHPLLLLPSVLPSIRVFSSELAVCIKWPKYRSFSFSISPSNEYSGGIKSTQLRKKWYFSKLLHILQYLMNKFHG